MEVPPPTWLPSSTPQGLSRGSSRSGCHCSGPATRVAVVAAALNPLDLVVASGSFHSARHESPYVPGSE